MRERTIKTLNLVFTLILLFSFPVCVAGPLAVALGISSPWLFIWPLAFWTVRFMGFFVFPLIAVIFIFLARPTVDSSRTPFRFACLNFVLALVFAFTVWGIESWSVTKVKSLYMEQVGDGSIPAPQQPIVGREIPNITLVGLDGKKVDI